MVSKDEWFSKRPEWRMHDNHPDVIEICGACGTTRIFRNQGHSKCYRCGFDGQGLIYVKQGELDNQVC